MRFFYVSSLPPFSFLLVFFLFFFPISGAVSPIFRPRYLFSSSVSYIYFLHCFFLIFFFYLSRNQNAQQKNTHKSCLFHTLAPFTSLQSNYVSFIFLSLSYRIRLYLLILLVCWPSFRAGVGMGRQSGFRGFIWTVERGWIKCSLQASRNERPDPSEPDLPWM